MSIRWDLTHVAWRCLLIVDCFMCAVCCCWVWSGRLRTSEVRWSTCSCLRLELKMECRTSGSLSLLICLGWRYQILHLLSWCFTAAMRSSFVSYTLVIIWIWARLVKHFRIWTQRTILTSRSFALMMWACSWCSKVSCSTNCLYLATVCKIIKHGLFRCCSRSDIRLLYSLLFRKYVRIWASSMLLLLLTTLLHTWVSMGDPCQVFMTTWSRN